MPGQFKAIPAEQRAGALRPVGKGEIIGLMVVSKDKSFRAFVGARSVQDVLSGKKPYAVLQVPKRMDEAADEQALQNIEKVEE